MVNESFNAETMTALHQLVGKTAISLECSHLDQFNRTFGSVLISVQGIRMEFAIDQRIIPYFNATEEWPILTCKQYPLNSVYQPFQNIIPDCHALYGAVQGIDVIDEGLNFPTEGYSMLRTVGIILYTDSATDKGVSLYAPSLFNENITVNIGDTSGNGLPSTQQTAALWKDNTNDRIVVNRTIRTIR